MDILQNKCYFIIKFNKKQHFFSEKGFFGYWKVCKWQQKQCRS